MAPEFNAQDDQTPPVLSYADLSILVERGHFIMPDRDFTSPAEQIDAWCAIAVEDAELGGSLARKSLEAAVATVDSLGEEGCEESHSSERYSHTRLYVHIAQTAWKAGQDTDYVRGILDKAVSSVSLGSIGNDDLQRLRFGIVAKAAHETGQDSDYLQLLVDRIREADANVIQRLAKQRPERVPDTRVKQLERVVELSHSYGLGTTYIRGLFDAAREGLQTAPDASASAQHLTSQVHELVGIASLADYWQDPEYIYGIIEQGRAIANLGAKPQAFAELAKLAHAIEGPGNYHADILVDALHSMDRREEEPPITEDLRALNSLLQATNEPGPKVREVVQTQIVTRGMRLIERSRSGPRQSHMFLNMLLRGVQLADGVMDRQGVERKPLSYVYRPGDA